MALAQGRIWAVFTAFLLLAACTPTLAPPGPPVGAPRLAAEALVMDDGARLPLHAWRPDAPPRAVILALHGFNDYGTFITAAAEHWRAQGIATYAYDQRGFGDAPNRGLWPGRGSFAADLRTAARLIAGRHPKVPLFVLGESMGAAVVLTAMAEAPPPEVAGVILSAPAVWARSTMPGYQRLALWIAAHTVPWMTLTGRGLDIVASDNIEMLRALGRDAKVIKATRVDTIAGLTDLMDDALDAAARLTAPALVLWGERDEIITARPTRAMLERLPDAAADRRNVIVYTNGYHMLLRDLGAERVWRDIAAWIDERIRPGTRTAGGALYRPESLQ